MANIKYYDVILKPVVTEKSMGMMATENSAYKKEYITETGEIVQKKSKGCKPKQPREIEYFTERKYVFYVHKDANKVQVKEAVEKMFDGVQVEKVNIMNLVGKAKRRGTAVGRTSHKKKAIVKLKRDSKEIEIFQGM